MFQFVQSPCQAPKFSWAPVSASTVRAAVSAVRSGPSGQVSSRDRKPAR